MLLYHRCVLLHEEHTFFYGRVPTAPVESIFEWSKNSNQVFQHGKELTPFILKEC